MKSDSIKTFVVAMLLLQAIATASLWILNVLSAETTGVFAVLLAANLIAFAAIVHVYRNPDTLDVSPAAKEPAPAAAPTPSPGPTPAPAAAPAPAAPVKEIAHSEPTLSQGPVAAALPRIIHIGIPVASIIVLIAFAIALFLPANKSTLPVESTAFFIPIYLTIVIVLVLGSMYLFKRLMDAEDYAPAH
jgi:hypothetical protein